MGTYKIISGEWQDKEHGVAILTVTEDGGEPFLYTSDAADGAPVNRLLWEMLQRDSSMVQDSAALRVLKGGMEAPAGFTLIDGRLANDEEEKIRARGVINGQLDELYSGRAMAMAERDPEYAANRKRQIDWLLSLENSPGFPYEIDFSPQEDL